MFRLRFEKRALLFFLLCLLFLSAGCRPFLKDVSCRRSELLMDTVFTVIAYGCDREHLNKSVEAAFAEIRRIQGLTDCYASGSVLSRLNAGPAGSNSDSETSETENLGELYDLLQRTCMLGNSTGGMFDPALGPVIDLWDFKAEHPSVPAKEQIRQALEKTGLDKLSFSPEGVPIMAAGAYINLSGAAKGYAVDRAALILQKHGLKHYLVDGGGEVRARGGKPDGKPWRIGIRDPRGTDCVGFMEVDNLACATSGDYERYFEQGGRRYHHILDPRTGYPAEDVVSTTVIASSVFEADILSTSAFVGGESKLKDISDRWPAAGFILFVPDGSILCAGRVPDSLSFVPGRTVVRLEDGAEREK